jgi:hypothetical protein
MKSYSSERLKAIKDAARPANLSRLSRLLPIQPSPTYCNIIAHSGPPIARNSTIAPPEPHCGATYLTKTPAIGKRLRHSPPCSSTHATPSAPHLRVDSNGHRTAHVKVPPPPLAASGPHSTSSNTWVVGQKQFCHRREIHRPHHDPVSSRVVVLWLARPGQTASSRLGCAKPQVSFDTGKTCPRVNSHIVLNLEVCKIYLHM